MHSPTTLAFPGIKIISGGQTGADRAGLDFAIAHEIPHGGWCPKGRRAEDGKIDEKYLLKETPNSNYLQRNEWNVRDSDATVIFTMTATLGTGSKKTQDYAKKQKKPVLHLARSMAGDHGRVLNSFLNAHRVKTLNIAGSRGSNEPEVAEFVAGVLAKALLV